VEGESTLFAKLAKMRVRPANLALLRSRPYLSVSLTLPRATTENNGLRGPTSKIAAPITRRAKCPAIHWKRNAVDEGSSRDLSQFADIAPRATRASAGRALRRHCDSELSEPFAGLVDPQLTRGR
jgi:hypothetical protein